ncbi:hypothetical protein VCSRO123_2437 [Vibrio cholerae]|nr:hypothetical protein VCSRO123_2437 [Vibrio cholerae]
MDLPKSVIDRELYSYINSDKEFCYLLWLMLMDSEVLSYYYNVFYDRHLATKNDFTVKPSLYLFINDHVEFLYKIPSAPRTHDERFLDINFFCLILSI